MRAQLDHPVIRGVIDSSVADDSPYLVMRYLHGVALSAVITRWIQVRVRNALTVNLMAYIAATVCEGLHGYICSISGSPGPPALKHSVARDESKASTPICPPEQFSGQPLDRRSDIFSLGIVLWEAIPGRHLFKRKSDLETLRAIKQAAVAAPSELNPVVPQRLDANIARSLVAARRRRSATADAMGAALWQPPATPRFRTRSRDQGADQSGRNAAPQRPASPNPGPGDRRFVDAPPEALETA